MRIGVDATCWQNTRGYGRHARSLLTELVRQDKQNHYTFFMDAASEIENAGDNVDIRLVHASVPTAVAASARGRRSARDMWRLSREMSRARLDLLLFPTIYSYVPVITRAKKVVIIHDIIAETYPQLTLPDPSARLFWKTKVTLGRWQADAIATVSEYSRKGIVHYFKLPPDRVHVVGEASDDIFRPIHAATLTPHLRSLGLKDQRFIVYVGGFSPHKNLESLVTAFADLARRNEFADLSLVMVGEYRKEVFHSYFNEIKARIDELGLSDRVIFTGYLPDEELAVLLNCASVLVLPSLIEGFGLPAVEAAACGCPVIATTESPLPGLLGKGALYFDPRNQPELTKSLELVLSSEELRNQLSKDGRAAAEKLTWEAAAKQLLNLMQTVMAQSARNASTDWESLPRLS